MVKLSSKKQLEFDLTFFYLIGKNVEIINSNNSNQIGIDGLFVKETANFIFLKLNDDNNQIKPYKKVGLIIRFVHEEKSIKFNCNQIKGSIQQRIKKFK